MVKVKYIILETICEFEWIINFYSINKIDIIWLSLEEISLDRNYIEILKNVNMVLNDANNENLYLIYSNFVIKKTANILTVKLDRKKEIENLILRVSPKYIKKKLLNLIYNQKIDT
jgi:hypothetical protein